MALQPSEIVLKTPQFDSRFPNQNQTKNCWQNYVDYHACVKAGGGQCEYYLKVFRSLCPKSWTDQWDEQREAGSFPGKI